MRGLFPKTKALRRGNTYGGTAGNSSSSNKPGPGTSDYDAGYTGDRASRQAGGESLGQQQRGKPFNSDKSTRGDGGFAWDASCEDYYRVPERGSKRGY